MKGHKNRKSRKKPVPVILDFMNLRLDNVRTTTIHGKESRIGERGNETYIYREYSGDSRPTLEKQVNGRPKIKIRYEE